MNYIAKVIKCWLILAVTSFGIWAILYQISGLWADNSRLVGYHSFSSDTSYLSLTTLVLIILGAKIVQALVLVRMSERQRLAGIISIAVIDNILWLSIFLNNYGIKSQDSFNVAVGYGYLIAFALLSNAALLVGLLFKKSK